MLREYDLWAVYLHTNQVYLGRSYIALARDGDIDPFTETTAAERAELDVIVGGLRRCLDELYQPDKLNYANLRNEWHHCHWHVIPRYQTSRTAYGHTFTDSKPGKNYAPYDKNFQVPPEVFDGIKADLTDQLATV